MKARILLLAPLALALGGCMSMGTPYTSYPAATTYAYPTYPGTTYPPGTYGYSHGYPSQPAVVAPRSYNYSYGSTDYDGDGVHNTYDRFPADRSRW